MQEQRRERGSASQKRRWEKDPSQNAERALHWHRMKRMVYRKQERRMDDVVFTRFGTMRAAWTRSLKQF